MINKSKEVISSFQTPPIICDYMVSLLPKGTRSILEPTPGDGNLVSAAIKKGLDVYFPPFGDFFKIDLNSDSYESICMNPPFSPMVVGYEILYKCLKLAPEIVALMPWLTIINSEKRTKRLKDFGLVSITHLPRNIFPGSRVQTCVLKLSAGFLGDTKFIIYES